MKKKYIISGIPGTGKSTLIKSLNSLGFPVMEEISRSVILSEQDKKSNGTPWQDIEYFTELVYTKTLLSLENNKNAIFSDRSLLDNIAYLQNKNKRVPNKILNFPFQQFYESKVFYAPAWEEIYCNDPQRPENFDALIPLNNLLKECYLKMGFKLCIIPKVSVKKRTEFILSQIQKCTFN